MFYNQLQAWYIPVLNKDSLRTTEKVWRSTLSYWYFNQYTLGAGLLKSL